jgi:hypothetical protein
MRTHTGDRPKEQAEIIVTAPRCRCALICQDKPQFSDAHPPTSEVAPQEGGIQARVDKWRRFLKPGPRTRVPDSEGARTAASHPVPNSTPGTEFRRIRFKALLLCSAVGVLPHFVRRLSPLRLRIYSSIFITAVDDTTHSSPLACRRRVVRRWRRGVWWDMGRIPKAFWS